jgi:hypothetical protein
MINIIYWVYKFLSSIQLNSDEFLDEKLQGNAELDKRWIFDQGQWRFNIDYPVFREDAYRMSDRTVYNFKELIEGFRTCNIEFNFNTDFLTNTSHVQQPLLTKIPKLPSKAHLVLDFDQIQLYYRQLCYDAKIAEDYERIYEQKTETEQMAENQTLRRMINAYIEGPHDRDELFHAVNYQVFGEREDDPLSLYEFSGDTSMSDQIKKTMKTNVEEKYPKLKCLSKRTLGDREYRRNMLLSSKMKYFIESERVSAVLNEFKNPKPKNQK